MKQLLLIYCLFIVAISCRTNRAAQQAKSYYAKFKHLSDPEHNFEHFWNHFNDNYAFFDLKQVDWGKSYETFRPQVSPQTSTEELLSIFAQMVIPLKDGHIGIFDPNYEEAIKLPPLQRKAREVFTGRVEDFTNNSFKVLRESGFGEMTQSIPTDVYFHSKYIYQYCQSPKLAYLYITDFRPPLEAFDAILQALGESKGLIIDLRFNPGGEGGFEMAGRFLAEKTLSNYYRTRIGQGENAFTAYKAQYVAPQGHSYLKPLVILVNDLTSSAAEDFTLALSQQAHVTILGTHTFGGFSSVFSYRLPNKHIVWAPSVQYFSTDTLLLEDKGVQPTLWMENTLEDLNQGRDPLIDKAIELLEHK